MDKETINYFNLYDKLYSLGYHSKLKNHGKRYVKMLCMMYSFQAILEIGCSNGMAVRSFMKRKKDAYGIDVSEIAIRYAAEVAMVPNCIIAPAYDIPFKDKLFDAIFSCDVFEHMIASDISRALNECKRLTKKYLFLVLDFEIERNRDWLDKAKIAFPKDFNNIDNLHFTVWTEHEWIKVIRKHGFNYINHHNELYVFEVAK